MKKIAIIILLLASTITAADIKITATVDRSTVAVNQTFTYTLEISGEKATSIGEPELPDMSEFAVYLGSSGTSQNIQIINGKMSISRTLTFSFMASKVGKFTIGPASLKYRGETYKTEPIEIEIVKQAPQSGKKTTPGQRRNRRSPIKDEGAIKDNLFLRAFINKKQVYVNEPVILTYKIYTAVTVTSYGISKQPNTAGFWAEEFPMGPQPKTYREMYNGREFIVADIKKLALFPTSAGKKTISPMQIECDVRVQTRHRSIFDSFFDDPFFGKTVRQTVYSPPVSIEVLPLPTAGKPANFSGAVGNFTISASVDKNSAKTNEAIALKVKIAGTGNIKVLPTPDVEIPPDFEQYEPKVSEKINRKANTISGSKTFEYVLIPRFPGIQKIKPIKFSYFDPHSKSYKQLATPEIVINVTRGNEEFVAVGTGLSKEEVRLLGKDIRFIQKHPPEFRKIGRYMYNSPLYMVLLAIPLLFVGVAAIYRRQQDKISGDIAYARSRKANQIAMNRLRKAKKMLSEKTQKQFYAETSQALLGFLADKLNISAAGIITDEVEQMMRARQIDETVIEQYLKCLQVCDYQRFAPSNASLDEMKKFYEQAKTAIIALEKVI